MNRATAGQARAGPHRETGAHFRCREKEGGDSVCFFTRRVRPLPLSLSSSLSLLFLSSLLTSSPRKTESLAPPASRRLRLRTRIPCFQSTADTSAPYRTEKRRRRSGNSSRSRRRAPAARGRRSQSSTTPAGRSRRRLCPCSCACGIAPGPT